MTDFDRSRLSNAGKNVAKDYARFRKSCDTLMARVDEAIEAGLTTADIEGTMLRFCTPSEMRDCVICFDAASKVRETAAQS